MHIQPPLTMVALLAMMLMSPAVQAIGVPSSDAGIDATTESSRTNVAVLPAPTGHRQPTLNDLPPWLRDEEKPGADPTPEQGPEQRAPRRPPDDGVPRICEPC
jgi:hypothetical protein